MLRDDYTKQQELLQQELLSAASVLNDVAGNVLGKEYVKAQTAVIKATDDLLLNTRLYYGDVKSKIKSLNGRIDVLFTELYKNPEEYHIINPQIDELNLELKGLWADLSKPLTIHSGFDLPNMRIAESSEGKEVKGE